LGIQALLHTNQKQKRTRRRWRRRGSRLINFGRASRRRHCYDVVQKMRPVVCIAAIVLATLLNTQCKQSQEPPKAKTTMDNADFDLVMEAYDKANELIRQNGWDGVDDEHRHLTNVIAFYSKVENGGFGSFYFDSDYLPDMMEELSVSLKLVGATRAEELMRISTKEFDGGVVPKGLDGRVEVARTYPDDFDPFEDLDTKFFAEAEEYIPLLVTYVRTHSNSFK
jgi:hypothetical protein